jgi:hypothetical protein
MVSILSWRDNGKDRFRLDLAGYIIKEAFVYI